MTLKCTLTPLNKEGVSDNLKWDSDLILTFLEKEEEGFGDNRGGEGGGGVW